MMSISFLYDVQKVRFSSPLNMDVDLIFLILYSVLQ